MDGLGIIFLITSNALWLMTAIYSDKYLELNKYKNKAKFYIFFSYSSSSYDESDDDLLQPIGTSFAEVVPTLPEHSSSSNDNGKFIFLTPFFRPKFLY